MNYNGIQSADEKDRPAKKASGPQSLKLQNFIKLFVVLKKNCKTLIQKHVKNWVFKIMSTDKKPFRHNILCCFN